MMAEKQIQKVSQALQQIDSAHSIEYEQRTQALLAQISVLNTEYQNGLAACLRRDFITSHAAFGYVAKRYNLNQLSISGISPNNEPTAKEMAQLVTFAKDHDIHYIFFESLVSPKLAETIADEIGAETLVLDPIEGITDQQMKEGVNYLTIMKDNLKALQTALQCQT
jgi:zinc transport system substrate-binding protein